MSRLPVIGTKTGIVILVDEEDYEYLSQFTWRAACTNSKFYAAAIVDGVQTYMHRLLMKPEEGLLVDHINGLTLDNRRSNLRIVTSFQNQKNSAVRSNSSTGFKGVSKHKDGSFQARIKLPEGKRISLGYFPTAELAGEAYATAAKQYYGEYAHVNV